MRTEKLTEFSKILYEKLFTRFPEWEKYAEFSIAENDSEKKSLYVVIPSPANGNHFISLEERGDCIEVAYSNGNPEMSAEYLTVGERNLCIKSAVEFVEEVIKEKIIVGQKKSFWGFGKKILPLNFISLTEANEKKFVNIYSWQGTFNQINS